MSGAQIGPATATPSTGHRRIRWPLALAVTAVVGGLLVLFGFGLIRAAQSGGIGINAFGKVGRIPAGTADDFKVPLFSGETFQLSQQWGKVVLVNFWASWCVPCQDEAPVLQSAWLLYHDQGVVFIGVDIWDSDADAHAFLQRFGITYPNGPDPSGRTSIAYGITGIPETYVIRRDGTIASHWVGPLTGDEIAALVADASQ